MRGDSDRKTVESPLILTHNLVPVTKLRSNLSFWERKIVSRSQIMAHSSLLRRALANNSSLCVELSAHSRLIKWGMGARYRDSGLQARNGHQNHIIGPIEADSIFFMPSAERNEWTMSDGRRHPIELLIAKWMWRLSVRLCWTLRPHCPLCFRQRINKKKWWDIKYWITASIHCSSHSITISL